MTTDANQAEQESELDLDFVADFFRSKDVELGDAKDDDQEEEEGDGASDKDAKEPEQAPDKKVHSLTDEELEAIVAGRVTQNISSLQDRAKAELQRRENEAHQRELDELLRNGSPEEVGRLVQQQIKEQEAEAAIASRVSSEYIAQVLPSILTDDFVESLTPEEAQSLLPQNFKTDGEFYKAVVEMRVTKARQGLYGEDEVKRRVEEELEARKNEQRGDKVRTPSPTNTPKTQEGGELQGLTGQRRRDAMFAMIDRRLNNPDED